MAIYRQISPSFWTDSKVSDSFTPEEKFFYLYLLTNQYVNICGCYELSLKGAATDLGYDIDTIKKLLRRMEEAYNVIRYNETTKEVLILKWHKYNWTKSDKLIRGLTSVVKYIKTAEFRSYVEALIDAYQNDADTVYIPYPYRMDTSVSVSVSDTDSKKKDLINSSNLESTINVQETAPEEKEESEISLAQEEKTEQVDECEQKSESENTPKSAFSLFWRAYPRKVDKKKAQKAFERAIMQSVPIQIILDAIEKQKQYKNWCANNNQFVEAWPHPTTWLNGNRWEDDAEIPESSEPPKTLYDHEVDYYKAAVYLDKQLVKRYPDLHHKDESVLQSWADEFRMCETDDGYSMDVIETTLMFSQKDEYWQNFIQNPKSFRRNIENLIMASKGERRR